MRKTAATLLVGVALITAMITTASASHYVYVTEDHSFPFQISGGNGLSENHANWHWTLASTSDVLWHSDSGIRDEVVAAIAEWELENTGLSWEEDSNDFDVDFYEDSSCGGRNAAWENLTWFEDEGANYWVAGEVCVSTSAPWADSDELTAGIAHEIGHAHGLHERYRDNQSPQICNPSGENVIMDGPEPTAAAMGTVVHCDSPITGPTSTDLNRIDQFYGGGQLDNWEVDVDGSGPIYDVSWEDHARAEYKHQIKFLYWNGSIWVEYEAINHTGDIGSSEELPVTWSIGETIDTSYAGYNIPSGTNTHIVCGDPWYMHDSSAGDFECSSSFQVTTP